MIPRAWSMTLMAEAYSEIENELRLNVLTDLTNKTF